MRCLGRLIFAFLLLLLLAAGWVYRDEIKRWARGVIDPAEAAQRVGIPSPSAYQSATAKVNRLTRNRPDSIVLNANELAALLTKGAGMMHDLPLDSISVELGNRTVRVRAMVNTARLPERYRKFTSQALAPYEEVIATGTLTPVRDGLAELRLDRVLVRGLPVPSDVVASMLGEITGHASDGRLEVTLPNGVTGFRVRPEGMAIYRNGPR